MRIIVEKPTQQELDNLGVFTWPIWEKEPSKFPWHYDEKEVCYFLQGRVVIETKNDKITFGKGDLVTFPSGLDCTWHVIEAVRKHYQFS